MNVWLNGYMTITKKVNWVWFYRDNKSGLHFNTYIISYYVMLYTVHTKWLNELRGRGKNQESCDWRELMGFSKRQI